MYKIEMIQETSKVIRNIEFNIFIPFDPANTDYQRFKLDLTNGAELQDADGVVMTQKQVNDFLKTVP